MVCCSLRLGAAEPWQELSMPTVAEAAASFANPPKDYGAIHWALGWPPVKERILADIEQVNSNGGGGYMINSGGRQPKYLSPEYLDLFKFAVQECKKRGMKMWIDGDDGYPDGLAGGRISKEYPQLGMQGIIADAHYTVAAGQTLDIPLPAGALGILANPRAGAAAPGTAAPAPPGTALPLPADRQFKWTAPGSTVSGSDRFLTWEVNFQGSAGDARYSVVCGQTLSIPLPPGTRGILANPAAGGRGRGGGGGPGQPRTVLPLPADGQFKWTAPESGTWEITFVRHLYRSSPTRYGQREDGTRDKDSLYSLIDYLDPEATATYLKLVEETYGKVAGEEFGSTIHGFRGDETDYTGFMPWTPRLLETFQKQKGYDLTPYIAQFFATPLTPEARRAKADYWDVWSGMFRDNFYKPMQDWCQAHHMVYMLHLNHEETMLSGGGGEDMTKNEGSYWRDMRYVGVPGVDNLNQIGPGIVADFPKIAGSAAHLFGRPQAWSEEGGEPGQGGKFVFDYQLVRGLNYMNVRGLNAAPRAGGGALQNPNAVFGWYVTRSQYLMALGRPAAQVALYHPTDSFWLGDKEADDVQVKLVTQLMEHQIDFDHIDHDSLASVCTLDGGGLKNLSGQIYRAVIVPASTVIQKGVLERLRAFAAGGGKVVFVGRTPTMVVDRTFLHPDPAPDLSFATLEPTPEITARVVAALPPPDVKLDTPCPAIKYIHRSLKDGEVYLFFNETNRTQTRTAALVGTGRVQVWDAASGTIHPLAGVAPADGSVAVPLSLESQETRFIVIGPLPPGASGSAAVSTGQALAVLDGPWSVTLGEKQLSTPLKSWEEMGVTSFTGTAVYEQEFTIGAALPQDRSVYLDLGNVHEEARAQLNGTPLDARSWPPYVWDVTQLIKSGANTLEVQVRMASAGEERGAGGAGGRRGGAGAPSPPAGVPGALPADGGGGARGGGGAGANAGGLPGGARRGGPAVPAANSGLLGPVRLLAQ
ncbi:MAG: glycosyl hydrolase [Verrucomicrobiota bacterium]